MSNGFDPAKLASALNAVPLTLLPEQTFYRSVDFNILVQLGVSLLDGTHSGKTGGRYNTLGSDPTSYFAGSQTLAAFECEQMAMIMGLPSALPNPRITCSIRVVGAKVLDLTNSIVLATLGVDKKDLVEPSSTWRAVNAQGAPTTAQVIGGIARARAEIDGILAPSWLSTVIPIGALPRMDNLVLFMDPNNGAFPRSASVKIFPHDPTGLIP